MHVTEIENRRALVSTRLGKMFASSSFVTKDEAARIEEIGQEEGWTLRQGHHLAWSCGTTVDQLLTQYHLFEAA